jgi:cation/acetate symporter
VDQRLTAERRVILSKFALLAVALLAAVLATFKPAEILPLVTASFSLAASALVPVMVLGIFWARATRAGAIGGMLAGLGIALYYMLANAPAVRVFLGLDPDHALWFGIQPLLAGVFGVPAGFATTVLVSVAARARRPAAAAQV